MIDYIINTINETVITTEPFEHKFVNNIFPDEYYKKLIKNLPKKDEYIPINKSGTVTKNYAAERYMFDLNFDNIKKLNKLQQQTFTELINVFTSPNFFNAINNNFKKIIQKRISEFTDFEKKLIGEDKFEFSIQAMLVKDLQKYKLGAHTDITTKFLTFLFYIPKDLSQVELGTALYKPKSGIEIQMGEKGNYHATLEMTKEYFDVVGKVPFSPNSLLLFPRTNDSFHGVEIINKENTERDLIQLNYYFKTKI